MSPTEAKRMMDGRRRFITDTAVQQLLDLEHGWKNYAAAYLRDCLEWIVEDGGHGVGPQKPPNLDPWLARAIREITLDAEVVSRMGPRG